MSITYEACGKEVCDTVKATIDTFHPDLSEAGVTIHAVFARNENKDGEPLPAIKRNGYPALAKIQVTSLQDRARGMADAKLTIDFAEWDGLANTKRTALIDHELTHLKLKTEADTGAVKRDDLGRPKLGTRPHDWELAGFEEVVKRHGEASIEALQVVHFQDNYGQLLLFRDGAGR